ncbi:MBL fold metallo-hydrolase [Actinopolymorpha alba]|uniref:MBL fold metallo-hydrolase n=1 Tax=Actinopolymorpha alba TaxID=533267 RepID=UPI000380EB2D|nr:MBL fold metallo-hydrolase [Actinopolymorpha alba]
MQQIADNIYVELGNLGSNNAVITTSEGNVLIDAPHKPTDAVAWRKAVDELGPTKYLIHTDHHIDHTMGGYFLPGTVVAHERTRAGMQHDFPDPAYVRDLIALIDPDGLPLMEGHHLRFPDITFSDELDLYVGDVHLRLIRLSGHTPNTIGILLPEQRIFFSGDNVCEASLPSFQEAFVDEWLASLRRIAELDFDVLVPGHGEVCGKDVVTAFDQKAYALVGQVRAALDAGVSEAEAADTIRFEDRIHVTTPAYAGYPDDIVESLQRRSISRIYQHLIETARTRSGTTS